MASLAYIQLTRECNQHCRFCSNPPTKRTLSLEQGKKLIDLYIKNKYDGIIFTGGEPTLSPFLANLLTYAAARSMPCRMITNGQKLADNAYLLSLKKAGLKQLHLSFYSFKKEIQSFLTQNESALENIIKALDNLAKLPAIRVDINIVINHYNAGHLYENVSWIVKNFPFVKHFVWNNLDPYMDRARENPDTIPKLSEIELSLNRALVYLEKHHKTTRVERLPLCALPGFEHVLNETRKLVKKENRCTYFLDDRGFHYENDWEKKWGYDKADCCGSCFLDSICPGLYQMDKFYSSGELHPVFVNKEDIVARILYGK